MNELLTKTLASGAQQGHWAWVALLGLPMGLALVGVERLVLDNFSLPITSMDLGLVALAAFACLYAGAMRSGPHHTVGALAFAFTLAVLLTVVFLALFLAHWTQKRVSMRSGTWETFVEGERKDGSITIRPGYYAVA